MTKKTNSSESKSFVKKVMSRKEKPLHPTNQSFSESEWKEAFLNLDKYSKTDNRLFLSGILFAECFRKIENEFDRAIFRYNDTKGNLIRLQVGRINTFAKNESIRHYQKIPKTGQLLQSSINAELINNIETIIDAVCFSLIKIYENSNVSNNYSNNIELKDWLKETLDLSITYSEFKHFWHQCLRHNWYVDSLDIQTKVIRPANPDKFLKHYVSLSWNEEMLVSQSMLAIKDWKSLIVTEKHKLLIKPILKVEHITQKGELKFKISNRYQTPETLPLEIAVIEMAINKTHYQKLLKKPCPNFYGLILSDLLSCWRFISPIVSQIESKKHLPNNISDKEKLLRYSPTFLKEDLVTLIMEAFSRLTKEQALTIVNLFTYTGKNKDDIWCQPLVKVDDKRLTVVNTSLKLPNLLRCLDSWVEKSGWSKGKINKELGSCFEKFVRQKLENCNQSNKIKIYQESINFSKHIKGEKQQESDLIISIGHKIIIGEMKRSKYPTEPFDYGYYYQELEKAASQLKHRKEFVKKNLPSILEKLQLTHLAIEQVQVIPVIISSLPLATGQKFQGIPVVDIYILEWYLSQNKITWSTYTQKEQKEIQKVQLYSSEQEAENNIENYLNNPPQLKILSDNIKWQGIPIHNGSLITNNYHVYCYKAIRDNIDFSD